MSNWEAAVWFVLSDRICAASLIAYFSCLALIIWDRIVRISQVDQLDHSFWRGDIDIIDEVILGVYKWAFKNFNNHLF